MMYYYVRRVRYSSSIDVYRRYFLRTIRVFSCQLLSMTSKYLSPTDHRLHLSQNNLNVLPDKGDNGMRLVLRHRNGPIKINGSLAHHTK